MLPASCLRSSGSVRRNESLRSPVQLLPCTGDILGGRRRRRNHRSRPATGVVEPSPVPGSRFPREL